MTFLALAVATAIACALIFIFGHVEKPRTRMVLRVCVAVVYLVWIAWRWGLFAAPR